MQSGPQFTTGRPPGHINPVYEDQDMSNDRTRELRLAKLSFVKMPTIIALGTVKCGFELETQRVNGLTLAQITKEHSEESEPDFDEDGYAEYCTDEANETLDDANSVFLRGLFRAVCDNDSTPVLRVGRHGIRVRGVLFVQLKSLCRKVIYAIRSSHIDFSLPAFGGSEVFVNTIRVHGGDEVNYDSLWSELETLDMWPAWSISNMLAITESSSEDIVSHIYDWLWDNLDRSLFTSYPDDSDEDTDDGGGPTAHMHVPDGVEWKRDGSVTGPEFVTAGSGTSAAQFSSTLRKLFYYNEFVIDAGCSFHIHLSVPGIIHKHGKLFQAHLMEYLLGQIHRVPKSVRERWASDTGYFKPRLSKDKYTFVHFHESLGTWEFRCFGNVQSHADGMKCLKLAVEALRYAYSVQLKRAKPVIKQESDWSEWVLNDVLQFKMPAVAAIKGRRLHNTPDDESSAA